MLGKCPGPKLSTASRLLFAHVSVAAANYRDKPMSARGDDHARDTKRVEQLCEALMQRVANGREDHELRHAFLNYDMGRTPSSASDADNRNDMYWVKSHAMVHAIARSKARISARAAKAAAKTGGVADGEAGTGDARKDVVERSVKARGGGNWWGMMGRERAATLSAKELLSALQNMLARRIAQGRSKDGRRGRNARASRGKLGGTVNHQARAHTSTGGCQSTENDVGTSTVSLSDAALLARFCIDGAAHKASFGAGGGIGAAEPQIDIVELVAGIVRIGTKVRDRKHQTELEERLGRQRRTGLRARARAQRAAEAEQEAGATAMARAGTSTSTSTSTGHCFAWQARGRSTPRRGTGTAAFVAGAHAGDARAARQRQREEHIRAALRPFVSLAVETPEGQPPLPSEARTRRALGNTHGVLRFEPFLSALRNLLGAWDAKLLTGTLEHVTLADVNHVDEERARALFNHLDQDGNGAIALDTAVSALARLGANEPRAPHKRSLLSAGSAAKPALDRFGGGPCAVAHRHLY